MKLFSKLLIFVLTCGFVNAEGAVSRISSKSKNLGQVEKIYLSEGLISVLDFPEPIAEVKIGSATHFKVFLSENFNKEITLYLSKGTTGTFTNLIVRTARGVYVFDLIGSKTNHQDYLKVTGSYGRLQNSTLRNEKLIQRVVIGRKEPK